MARDDCLRVMIDAKSLGAKTGGDESYYKLLLRALAKLDTPAEFVLALNTETTPSFIEQFPELTAMRREVIPEKPGQRIPFLLPKAALRVGAQVLHTQHVVPPISPLPTVVTIHDVAFEHDASHYPAADARHLRMWVAMTARRASHILTVSEYSRQDIARRYRVDPDRITATHGGPDEMFRPLEDQTIIEAVREKFTSGEQYILCVGTLQPRKNLRSLIEAYVRLRKADRLRHKLVLVGRKGWLYDDIFTNARESGYADDLVFTDYVSEKSLVELYNAADVFVYPSIFEGLGLPPLEAMACGTPVITSNTSSLPEVVRDAGMTVSPLDIDALAGAIADVIENDTLRESLRERGKERVKDYSWERSARLILDVYDEVARSRQAPIQQSIAPRYALISR